MEDDSQSLDPTVSITDHGERDFTKPFDKFNIDWERYDNMKGSRNAWEGVMCAPPMHNYVFAERAYAAQAV
jgi:hypothetical protein